MQPASPPTPACVIDTRDPATGLPLRLLGERPGRCWQAADAAGAVSALEEAIPLLRRHPGGLLVALLPYPDRRGMAAEVQLFDHYRQADGHAALPAAAPGAFRLTTAFRPDWGEAGYRAAVQRVREYLQAGDAYQVNLAQRFSAGFEGDPYAAFLALRERFAPPYAAWLDLGDRQVLSLSPESFLEVDGDRVTTRPIKGTRPRGATPASDRQLAADLAANAKDRAENLMIVDLMRNDLGRVCRPGSVRVPSLFALESYLNVHHLVSAVAGQLQPGMGIPELLAACFPGGSITGAPKRRAMEIIAELEPHPRLAYCGSICWMTADGRFGSNIAIRTFVARGGQLHGWAGAGIVNDSDPAAEHRECLAKMQPLMRLLEEHFG